MTVVPRRTAPGNGARTKPPAAPDLLSLLKALADDTRLRIYTLLTKTELCVCEVEDILGLSQSLVSNHLAVLRKAGLVRARRDDSDSRWVFYQADAAAAAALRERLWPLLDVRAEPGDRRRAEQVCRLRGRARGETSRTGNIG